MIPFTELDSQIDLDMLNKYIGSEGYNFFQERIKCRKDQCLYLSTNNPFNILKEQSTYKAIANFSKVNNQRRINKFFIAVNRRLAQDGYYFCRAETLDQRRARKISKYPFGIGSVALFIDFLFFRVFPKVWGLKRVYFTVTRGRQRRISKAELLGRLISCGFEIIDFKNINDLLYVVAKKKCLPELRQEPSYGPLFKMKRVGKNGKIIGVYKFRTMHPYSEYVQKFIVQKYGYAESGKPANDFRLTRWGKFFRKYWIDELPQLLNVLKGEMKLVGVRPVSKAYFDELPDDIKKLRLKAKPGCFPPYVALNRPGSVDSVLEAERIYLLEKEKRPYTTDTKYFFKSIYVILFKGKRSA